MIIKNRFLLMMLALALCLTVVIGCSDDDPADPGDDNNTDPGLVNVGSISGIVSTTSHRPVAGATVTAGAKTTTTNGDGYFVLTAVPNGSTLVEFSSDDLMSTFRLAEVRSTAATHFPDVVLAALESGTVDGATGGTVTTGDGDGSAVFGSNSFVGAGGAAYTGDVNIQFSAMTPDDESFYGTFPGQFAGITEGGEEVPLVSYGFMTVQMTGTNKSPLTLADGTTAELNINIGADKIESAPATIPMWYFDETDGQWHEEGVATLSGSTYTANVAHFSTWNWDVPATDICSISGVVVDDLGSPVNGARVLSRGVDQAIMAEAFTASDGTFTVNALKNSVTDVWAVSGSRASDAQRVSVLEECPVALPANLVLMVPAYTISLTWGNTPDDLDAHLFIPATWLPEFDLYQLYYGNEGTLGENPYAGLDTDDQDALGPEIISGTRLYNGRFQYWVNNYSDDTSSGLSTSGASVQLEISGTLRQYNVADVTLQGANELGWWHVFDVVVSGDGASVTVESVMEYQAPLSGLIFQGSNERSKK